MKKTSFTRGDILLGFTKRSKDKALHLIVYWGPSKDTAFFVGLMLTNSPMENNIHMLDEHFEGGFIYRDTQHVVNAYLLKPYEWAPFKVVGRLSVAGIKFIEENVDLSDPQIWEDHLRS